MNVSKKNKQYPPQTGPYKVFVKDKGTWQGKPVARLQISMDNPKHTGDKFFALTEWAAARFDKVVLVVSDTLQRYNMALAGGREPWDMHGSAQDLGRKWMAENQIALDNIPPSRRVVTMWDDWIEHPDYAASKKEVIKLLCYDDRVRAAIETQARQGGEDIFRASIAYLVEEMAAFAVMFRKERGVDVYPGSWFSDIFRAIAGSSDSPLMEGFKDACCLRVDFTRNKAFRQPVTTFSGGPAYGYTGMTAVA